MSLASKYRREIQSWNWDAIIKEAKANHSETMDGDTVGMCYLGSLINPSGKYYLPFACSNVEPCTTCNGSGLTRKRGRVRDLNRYERKQLRHPESEAVQAMALMGECPTCHGIGSLEAYRDEVWNEVLEAVASEHGGSVEAGEGDPCDTFFVIALETEEEEDSETETEDTANA